MPVYAHTKTLQDGIPAPESEWEPLFTPFGEAEGECRRELCDRCRRLEPDHGHLNQVAWWTAEFTAGMFPPGPDRETARQWGRVAGLWHDLGKFPPLWQEYLKSRMDLHEAEVSGKVDHSTAGAQQAVRTHLLGHLLAYAIAGHHSGLLDGESNHACQKARLTKTGLPDWSVAPQEILSLAVPALPSFLQRDGFSLSFFTRMLFSALVDADFLATEAFMNPGQAAGRNAVPADALGKIADLVCARIASFGEPGPEDTVNFQRRRVVEECRARADDAPGLFTLTVPTGGGKTLSSLYFALLHALAHGQRRVIFVVPFTSIIEQNAEVIRKIIAPLENEGFTPLIEHHSNLSPDRETETSRLAAENWDAPIIITTAVQFYESLFAAKTSRCRKLHRIANSVVILDEAQTLPVDFLEPCLRVLRELSSHYHTSAVLCTATPPAVGYDREAFPIGLENCREIISDTGALFRALKRVELGFLGPVTDGELCERLRGHDQVLCIVNRRHHARKLFRLLGKGEGNYHLSALMCPEHRSRILAEVCERLAAGKPVRLISTQLIEAGVDVDFPFVYRSLAGLDSIAQATGRCNRNGSLPTGYAFIFIPEDQKGEAYFRETAQVASQLIPLHRDLLGLEAIHHYFDLYYYQQKDRWDSQDIVAAETFRLDGGDRSLPFKFSFASVAERFRLIDDRQVPILIPYDDTARELIRQLGNPAIPLRRDLLRRLQRYTVQIPARLRGENSRSLEAFRENRFHALVSTDLNYSDHFGLTFDAEDVGGITLLCDS